MLAAVYEGDGKLTLMDRPKPVLTKDTDVLIKVQGVGICGTDLHILQVPPAHPATVGSILGHEFTGEIVEVGSDVPDFKPGDVVIVDSHPGCGLCQQCKDGNPDRCIPLIAKSGFPEMPATIGIFSDGAMTNYVIVPKEGLFKISPEVPAYIRALAEPLACVLNAVDKVKVQPGDDVLVLGAGPIGLLFTSVLKANGASKVMVAEISEFRQEAAKDCGADLVINPKKENLHDIVMRETGGEGANIVVEAVGPLLPLAVELVRTRGTILQFGHDETVNPAIPVGVLLKKEAKIQGCFIGRYCYDRAAKVMESGQLPLERIVSHRLPLSKVHEGIDLLRQGKGIKIILEPEEDNQ